MKKVIFGVVVIAAIGIGAFYFLSNLNSIVAGAIEKHGSTVTDTNVGVSGVDISLRKGSGSIKGLRVGSPEGFQTRDAFSLGDITVDIDVGSVRENPVVIEQIHILEPVISAEISKTGSSNIEELRKRVQSYTSGAAGSGGDKSGGDTKRIRIKEFVLAKGRIEIDASAIGVEKRTITLPEIRLNDIGGAGGAAPDEITKVIVSAIAKKVTSEIANSELNRLIKNQLGGESVTDKAKGLLKKLGD